MVRLAPLCLLALSCGQPSPGTPAAKKDARAQSDAAPIELAPLALGLPSLEAFAYRKRAGDASYDAARAAEANGDWGAVAVACETALATDPDHLDAAYLLAVARAKTNRFEMILAPLTKAVAGDFAKWAQASLEQPALQPYLATAVGQAWRDRVTKDRPGFEAAVARSLVVGAGGDLFAIDLQASRWYRLTRTSGAIVATLPVGAAQRIAYVTRRRVKVGGGKKETRVALGVLDTATGRGKRPLDLPTTGTIRLAHNGRKLNRFVVRAGKAWLALDEDKRALVAVPDSEQPGYPAHLTDMMWLDLTGRTPRVTRLGIGGVSADWDERTLASALRIGTSKRVVTVPSPGLVDGNTLAWSPDRSQLAFVAQLADDCKPGVASAAAFVADAATGTVRELERAVSGIAIEWAGARRLAIAGDRGVSIVELGGGEPIVIAGAESLAWPKRQPRCTPEPSIEEPITDEDPVTDESSPTHGDAGLPPKP
jgi:hypothetical protein